MQLTTAELFLSDRVTADQLKACHPTAGILSAIPIPMLALIVAAPGAPLRTLDWPGRNDRSLAYLRTVSFSLDFVLS